ncbi:Gar1/Naf1 RNA binding region-domain-containing protein [Infundibulicybe gibba]|nr:Gar1/Naf1 RNA binding region-domain-containing protein [Infundibulicybe gibba]
MNGFKAPSDLPQDLLLIHEIIGITHTSPKTPRVVEDSIDSSDDESANGSEAEIEADLVVQVDEEESESKAIPSSPSSSSDSDSDSESVGENIPLDADDEEEAGPVSASNTYYQTKHEVPEVDIIVPEVEEVNPDEELEKVGSVLSIIDNVIIVQGLPGSISGHGAERTLDSDTLLVFEDRKVLGHIYETFGPTTQPLYQVRFNKLFPLDLEKVKISREIFHIPNRSHFVFVDQIKRLKGSDASNVHDEEPAADELEFSDDEAEAAFRNLKKRKRNGQRAGSVSSSRQPTPTPSQMRDQDLAEENFMSKNAYDEHGPYDLDFSSGFSRPTPIPYDDPYSDAYGSESPAPMPAQPKPAPRDLGASRSSRGTRGNRSWVSQARGTRDNGRGRGRRASGYENSISYDHADNSRLTHRSRDVDRASLSASTAHGGNPSTRPLSPTSLAIARATGQTPAASSFSSQSAAQGRHPSSFSNAELESWTYSLPPVQLGSHIQPHINPRFASAFGINFGTNVGTVPPQQYAPYGQYNQYAQMMSIPPGESAIDPSNWADEWTVRTGDHLRQGGSLGNQAPADDETI